VKKVKNLGLRKPP